MGILNDSSKNVCWRPVFHGLCNSDHMGALCSITSQTFVGIHHHELGELSDDEAEK